METHCNLRIQSHFLTRPQNQHKRPAELVACQLQTFGDTQQRSQTEWRDTFIASVDPLMPLIEKHG